MKIFSRVIPLLLAGLMVACSPPAPLDPGLVEHKSGRANPDEAERREVIIQTFDYWSALLDRRYEDAFAVHTEDYQEKLPLPAWRAGIAEDRPDLLDFKLIDWSQSFARYEGPELYAIIKWRAGQKGSGLKGLFIWRQEPDGSFRLENFEEGPF